MKLLTLCLFIISSTPAALAATLGGQDDLPSPSPAPPGSFSVELTYDGKEWNQVALWRMGAIDQPFGISVPGLSFPLFLGGGLNSNTPKGLIGGGVQYKFARNAHLLIGGILDITQDRKPRVTLVIGLGVSS